MRRSAHAFSSNNRRPGRLPTRGQQRSAVRKLAAREEKAEELRLKAALVGISVEELRRRRFAEVQAMIPRVSQRYDSSRGKAFWDSQPRVASYSPMDHRGGLFSRW